MGTRETDQRSAGPEATEASGDPRSPGTDAEDHLADIPDGCGCAEVWEHLSGHRS